MTELVEEVERRRLDAGLSQKAVADRLGISQPHYSKVVGGLAALTDGVASLMTEWLKANPSAVVPRDDSRRRIRELSRSIERDLRKLNSLLSAEGGGPARRRPRRTRERGQTRDAIG